MIDLTKTYRTRDGREVANLRLRTTTSDECGYSHTTYPIAGRIGENSSEDCWTSSGEFIFGDTGESDLVVGASSSMFDPAKPVQTRDGRKARILCTDALGCTYPLAALVTNGERESLEEFTAEGLYTSGGNGSSPNDLVNVPERIERFHTFRYATPSGVTEPALMLGTVEGARFGEVAHMAHGQWDGVVKLTLKDGKFLSAEAVTA